MIAKNKQNKLKPENRRHYFFRNSYKDAAFTKCPKCGASFDERELISRDFLGIEAVHMHYTCKKCGSEIIEEFTLTDVFIDNPTT